MPTELCKSKDKDTELRLTRSKCLIATLPQGYLPVTHLKAHLKWTKFQGTPSIFEVSPMKRCNKDNTAVLKTWYIARVSTAIALENLMYGYPLGVYLPFILVTRVAAFSHKKSSLGKCQQDTSQTFSDYYIRRWHRYFLPTEIKLVFKEETNISTSWSKRWS